MGRIFSSSYLAGDPAACAFLARDFRDPGARVAAVRAAAARRASRPVLEVLGEQQARLPPSPARDANLAALAGGHTAVVVTGQQVGLFLGPLYTFYKAASAIATARALSAEAGVRCVPLFWLQTEDHDFAEIAACHVAGGDGVPVTLSLAAEAATEARVSVAHRRLGPEVAGLVDALAAALGADAAADEVVALLRAHYVPGRPIAQAFAGVLAAIFADEGLLFLDPRDPRIAAAATPCYRRALDDAGALEIALRARGAALAAAGFGEQIPVRPACALLFFHQADANGPRFRLQRSADANCWGLSGANETISDEALRQHLERDPLRFSTSALLRPLVQDALLPTAATVAGPAELGYFAQLGPLYDAFELPAPLVIPRARFHVLDAATRRNLAHLRLSPEDALRPRGELLARLGPEAGQETSAPTAEALRRRVAAQLAAVDDLTQSVVAADARLGRAAARTRASVAHALRRFVDRYAREQAARDGVTAARLDKVQHALAPAGTPQERFYGWPSLAARHGATALKGLVMKRLAIEPFPAAPHELAP